MLKFMMIEAFDETKEEKKSEIGIDCRSTFRKFFIEYLMSCNWSLLKRIDDL